MSRKPALSVILLWGLALLLAACGSRSRAGQVFLPPTPDAARVSPVLTRPVEVQATAEVYPTATPACTNNLSFLEDLSIPDGSLVAPGDPLDKRWQVENSGTCNWDEQYSLRLLTGPDLGAAAEQALFPARSGTKFAIRIQFTAPSEPGAYRSAWQAYDPAGRPFGDPFFIDFVVTAQ